MSFSKFFKYVQDAPWYADFLKLAVDNLRDLPVEATILDVGTGAGKLLEAAQLQLGLRGVGTDVDPGMLAQARKRPSLANTPLHLLEKNAPFPFPAASFDAVCFCSVLFLVPDPLFLLREAVRVLRPDGHIVIITPTGNGRVRLSTLKQMGLYTQNWTFFLWRQMTSDNATRWAKKEIIPHFAAKNQMLYGSEIGFHGFAIVEQLHG